jgi:patatin-like phospholipase/acyl hydrolase
MSENTYNILALDGGGLRGLITSVLLERLAFVYPQFLENLDLVVGTSTGGILALAIAKGLPPSNISRMYMNHGKEIFGRSFLRQVGGLFSLTKAKYDNAALAKVLGGVFGRIQLKDLAKKVAITTFDLGDRDGTDRCWAPKIFHNFDGPDSDGDQKAVDVALYTSAAPSFFPSVGGYIDGGVVANNPSVVALAQALDARHILEGSKTRSLSTIRLLSVGTGTNLQFIEGRRHDWGIVEWADPLLAILIDGVSEVADFQCKQLLRRNYCRVQVPLPKDKPIPMDDVDQMNRMVALASGFPIADTADWLIQSDW